MTEYLTFKKEEQKIKCEVDREGKKQHSEVKI